MRYQATIVKMFAVSWPQGDDGMRETPQVFFENKEDADTVASAKMGSWGATGKVVTYRYVLGEDYIPARAYNTVNEWVDDHLTRNEARKHGFIV